MPCLVVTDLFHIAFYRFVRLGDPERMAERVRRLAAGLTGQVLLAHEGINGTLAGSGEGLDRFEHDLSAELEFSGLRFLRTACRTQPFGLLKVHTRREILPLGLSGIDAVGRTGLQLDALAWRAFLDDPKAVVIDNRNAFEYRLGHFRGALDPGVGNFRDLPRFIEAHAPRWREEGRRVGMYCTGGIRCEKTAAWMADAYGLEVAQLEGGILRYLAESPDAGRDWQGECFVFDNRVALDDHLQETGTTAAAVYAGTPDEAWRLERARRLAAAG